ncbi:MAG: hypothetical protein RBT75_03315 [Anaerolineae bacterium]|jgi:hypothetical protein|nr:hypothetical protein [Anaerolineae bacterium]
MEKIVVRNHGLETLAQLAGKAPGSVQLIAREHDHPGLDALAAALREHGAAVGALEASLAFPHHPFTHDLRDFDFAAACPHLTTLYLGRCRVNATVLCHPTLQAVTLEESWLFTSDPFRLGYPDSPASQVANLRLLEVNWGNPDEDCLSSVAFGPASPLCSFVYYGDEDNMEIYPETFTFEGCPQLAEVGIHVCGGWMAKFKGDLPQLTDLGLSSARYGDHSMYFNAVGDGSSDYLRQLRDGRGPYAGEQFLFIGEFPHFNTGKARHVLTQLGGDVLDTPAPALTQLVLGAEEYAAYQQGTPTPQVAEILAQGPSIEVLSDDDLREMLWGWY